MFNFGPPVEPEYIDDEEILTQRISRGPQGVPDIDAPRLKDRDAISLQRGHKTPREMFHTVRKAVPADATYEDEGARYARASDLRAAGFLVAHTPNRRSQDHVSITYPGDWDEDVALLFRSCFAEHAWGEEVESGE